MKISGLTSWRQGLFGCVLVCLSVLFVEPAFAGTCNGGPFNGSLCTSSSQCGKICSGGPFNGAFCTASSDCGRICKGGPFNGASCTTSSQCGRICSGGPFSGALCTSSSDCGGFTCATFNCGGFTCQGFTCSSTLTAILGEEEGACSEASLTADR